MTYQIFVQKENEAPKLFKEFKAGEIIKAQAEKAVADYVFGKLMGWTVIWVANS